MKTFNKTVLALTFLTLTIPYVSARTLAYKTDANIKNNTAQELGKKLLELLQNIVQKNITPKFQCCPCSASNTCKTKIEAEIKREQEEKKQGIQQAITLIKKGANVNYKDQAGSPVLNAAVILDDVELVQLLLQNNANPEPSELISPLIANILLGTKTEIAEMLIESGADVNFQMHITAHTPLISAVIKNKFDIAKLLIEKDADVNIVATMDMMGIKTSFCALALAVGTQNFPMTKLLLENGANPNAKIVNSNQPGYENGKTVLAEAKDLENEEIVNLLVAYGAKE